jgi:hypothetical protein
VARWTDAAKAFDDTYAQQTLSLRSGLAHPTRNAWLTSTTLLPTFAIGIDSIRSRKRALAARR